MVKIVIPSHKRANRVLTKFAVSNAILCVAESQKDEYAEHSPNVEIVTHPDSVIGISNKRNWIIKYFESVMMVDDDIDKLVRVYTEQGENATILPDVAHDIIQMTAHAAREAGAYVFGFSNSPNPVGYNSLNPITLTGFVNGCACGVLSGSKLWYNPDIRCNDDYWLSLLNAHYHRLVYRDTRFYFAQKNTFVNRGGNAEFRNLEAEKKDFEFLKRVFGNVIELRTNPRNAKHEFQKTMKLPF